MAPTTTTTSHNNAPKRRHSFQILSANNNPRGTTTAQLMMMMTTAEQPDNNSNSKDDESSQSAFLALLKLSQLLQSNRMSDRGSGSGATTAATVPVPTTTTTTSRHHPSIQLAVGAATAFGAIDRNILRAIGDLGNFYDSLRQMAVDEIEQLNNNNDDGDEAHATINNRSNWERSVEKVQALAAMDARISRAISELYNVGSSFKKAEAANNEFIGRLSLLLPSSGSSSSVAMPDLNEQAMETSQAFDVIDGRLSKALEEVKAIGAAFQMLQLQGDVVANDNSIMEAESPQPSPTTGAPVGGSGSGSGSDSSEYAPFSSLPVTAGGGMPSTTMKSTITAENTKFKVESALQQSIQVAQAFDNVDVNMVLNDAKILKILDELRTSVKRLATQDGAKKQEQAAEEVVPPAPRTPQPQQQVATNADFPLPQLLQLTVVSRPVAPLNEASPVFPSTPMVPQQHQSIPVETAAAVVAPDPAVAAVATAWKESRKLSQAAAKAWDNVNNNMVQNDDKALTVLRELSESFRALASSGSFLTDATAKTAPFSSSSTTATRRHIPIQQDPDVQSIPAMLPIVLASNYVPLTERPTAIAVESQPAVVFPPPGRVRTIPVSAIPTVEAAEASPSLENGMQLAIIAAEAFNEISNDMNKHHDALLAVYKDLRASLQQIVDKPAPRHSQATPEITTGAVEKAITSVVESATTTLSSSPPVGKPKQEKLQLTSPKQETMLTPPQRSTLEDSNISHKKATLLGMAAVTAFDDVDSKMSSNAEQMHSILQEISSNLRSFSEDKASTDSTASPDLPPKVAAASGLPLKTAKTTSLEVKQDIVVGATQQPTAFVVDSAPKSQPLHVPSQLASAHQLGLQAAAAFADVDAAMAENDAQMIGILQDIRSSLEVMRRPKTQQASTLIIESTKVERSVQSSSFIPSPQPITPLAPTTPQSAKVLSVDSSSYYRPTETTLVTQPSELATEQAIQETIYESHPRELATDQAIQEAASAFQALGASMVKNDKTTLSLLSEISSNLSKMAETGLPRPDVLPERIPSCTPPQPILQLEQQVVTRDMSSSSKPISSEPVPFRTEATLVEVSTQPKEDANKLSLQAAHALDKVDSDMKAKDENMLHVLQDISSTIQTFVEQDHSTVTTSQEVPKVVPVRVHDIEEALAELPAEAWPFPTSINVRLDEGQVSSQTAAAQMENESAHALCMEAATAFGRVDAAMVENDKKSVLILREIKASLRQLVDAAPAPVVQAGLGKEETHRETIQLEIASQANAPPANAVPATVVSPALTPPITEFSAAPKKAIIAVQEEQTELVKAHIILETIRAFDAVNENMVENDERALAVLNEISSSLLIMVEGTSSIAPIVAVATPPELHSTPQKQHLPENFRETPAILVPQILAVNTPVKLEPVSPYTLPMPARATSNQEEAAQALSREAATAFGTVDSIMNDSDEKMIAMLKDISSNFKGFVDRIPENVGARDTSKEQAPSTPAVAQRDAIAQPSSQFQPKLPPAVTQTATLTDSLSQIQLPVAAVPEVSSSFGAATKVVHNDQSRAEQLSTEAAGAFGRLDASMMENDVKATSILREIRASLKQLEDAKPILAQASVIKASKEATAADALVEDIVSSGFDLPLPTEAVSDVSSSLAPKPFSSVEESHPQAALANTQAILETARAFDIVDENMVENDARALAVLNEIRSSLFSMVNAKEEMMPTLLAPLSTLKKAPELRIGQHHQKRSTEPEPAQSYSLPKPAPVGAATMSREEAAWVLSLEAANAFGTVDSNMNTNDEAMLAVLNEISSNSKLFVEKEPKSVAATAIHIEQTPSVPSIEQMATLAEPLSQSPMQQLPERTPSQIDVQPHQQQAHFDKPVQPESVHAPPKLAIISQEESAWALSLEAANAFGKVDSNMNTNDEAMLAVLNDISSNLKGCAEKKHKSVAATAIHTKQAPHLPALEQIAPLSESPPQVQMQQLPKKTSTLSAVQPHQQQVYVGKPVNPESVSTPAKSEAINQEEVACDLSLEATNAFSKVDSNMNTNDEVMLAVLNDISSNLKVFVCSTSPKEQHTQDKMAPSIATIAQTEAPVVLLSIPKSNAFTAPVATPVPGQFTPPTPASFQPPIVEECRSQSRAEQLGREAAAAFGRVDITMGENAQKSISILREIKASLKLLENVKPMPTSQVAPAQADAPKLPREEIPMEAFSPRATFETAAPTEPANTYEETKEVISVDLTENAKAQAILEAVRAFEAVDENMVKNDERTLSILEEISSSLASMVELPKFVPPRAQENVPNFQVSEVVINQVALQPAPSPLQQSNQSPMMPQNGSSLESSSNESTDNNTAEVENYDEANEDLVFERALELSIDAARAFNKMDETMSQNDKQSTSILVEISASFQRLVEADKQNIRATESASISATDSPPVVLAPSNSATSTTTLASSLKPQDSPSGTSETTPSVERLRKEETQATAGAFDLSQEAAFAFNCMDANMMTNDKRTLDVLSEIKHSFGQLAKIGKLPEKSPPSIQLHALPSPPMRSQPAQPLLATGLDSTSAVHETSLQTPIEREAQSVDPGQAEDWRAPAADAFDRMNQDMSRNDEVLLDEFREMSSLFRKMNSADFDRLFSVAPSESLQPGVVTKSQEQPTLGAAAAKAQKWQTQLARQDGLANSETASRVREEKLARAAAMKTSTILDRADERATETNYDKEFKSNLQFSLKAAEAFLDSEENKSKQDGETVGILARIVASLKELVADMKDLPAPLFQDPPAPPKITPPVAGRRLMQLTPDGSGYFLDTGGLTNLQHNELYLALATTFDEVIATAPQKETALLDFPDEISASICSLATCLLETETLIWERAHEISRESAKAVDDLTLAMTDNDEIILDELRTLSNSFKQLASRENNFRSSSERPDKPIYEEPAITAAASAVPTSLGKVPSIQAFESTAIKTLAPTACRGSGGTEKQITSTQQPAGLAGGGAEKHQVPTGPANLPADYLPMSGITGKEIAPEEYERRKTQFTEGSVDELGNMLVQGLDRRLTELNDISSIFKDLVNDNRVDLAVDAPISSTPAPAQQQPFGISPGSSVNSLPLSLLDPPDVQDAATRRSNPFPVSNVGNSIERETPPSRYEEYIRNRKDNLQDSGSEAVSVGATNNVADATDPQPSEPIAATTRPEAKEYVTSPPQPGFDSAITKARAEGGRVRILQSPSPGALTAVGALSVGVGLAISSLPPGAGDEMLTTGAAALSSIGMKTMKGVEEAITTAPDMTTNSTIQSPFQFPTQTIKKLQSIVPFLGDFQILNVDPNLINPDTVVRNIGKVNPQSIDSAKDSAKTLKKVAEQKVPELKKKLKKKPRDPANDK